MPANFTEILDKRAEDVKEPPPMPVGTYLCIVDGPHEFKEVQTFKVCEFKLKTMQAQGDVDMQALAEAGGVGRPMRHGIFLNDKEGNETDWGLVRFLSEHLGIEKSGKTIREMLAEAPGKQVLASIKHVPSKDGQRLHSNIASTAHV